VLLACRVSDAAAAAAGPYTYETVKISDGVYGFFEPKMQAIVSGNVIAVIGEQSILVFDTGHHPPLSRAIAAELKRLSDKPVRYIVVSHWHDDHWVGNAEFAAAYPDVQVIAHPFTAQLMQQRKTKFSGAPCKSELEEQIKPVRDQLAGGKKHDGGPLTDDDRAKLGEEIAGFDEQIRECGQARYRGVDLTFETELHVQLGGREVRLQHLGRGNTAGDVVAYLPESKILLTGDLLVYPFPFATQSYISEWAAVLRKLDAMDVSTIVPGHGPVMHDKQYLQDVAALFETVSAQAHAAYRPGMSADELRAKVDISAQSAKFSHGERFIKANFDYMIGQPSIDRLWQELTHQWKPEGD
jgi:cyclase